MDESVDNQLLVVIIEREAAWPPWLEVYQRQIPNAVVIARAEDESAEHWIERVNRRISDLHKGAKRVRLAFLLTGPDHDEVALEARRSIGAVLTSAISQIDSGGELVLVAESRAAERQLAQLFALAEELCDRVRGFKVQVRVRFFERTEGARSSFREVEQEGLQSPSLSAAAR